MKPNITLTENPTLAAREHDMNQQRIINSALDCISRFRATRFPLKNVAHEIIKARKLNSSERKIFFDAVFNFIREIFLFNKFLDETVKFSSSMSVQQKDALLLDLILNQEKADIKTSYQDWQNSLGIERYLISLGPLISSKLKAAYGDNAAAIALGLARKPKKYLALDTRFITVEQLSNALGVKSIQHTSHPMLKNALGFYDHLDLETLPSSIAPHVWFMDAGSQIVASLLTPKRGERVLDMCAGEGNKARFIASKDCLYVASDIDQSRISIAQKRLPAKNIQFLCADGMKLPFADNSFEWILLDAPCSGTGTVARNPDICHRLTNNDLDAYVQLQEQLLTSATRLLKKGGILIYATCSLIADENEQQIMRVLTKNSSIKPINFGELVGSDVQFSDAQRDKNSCTLLPHINDCDGFFVAALTK